MAIWRIDVCKSEAGYKSNASIYNLMRDGLWTTQIKIGSRTSGWPSSEVKAICAARAAGYTESQLRELVKRLHAKRIELAAEMCA